MGESLINKAKNLGGKVWDKFTTTVSPKIKSEARKIVKDSKDDIAMSIAKAAGMGLMIFAVYSVATNPVGASAVRYSTKGLDEARMIYNVYNEVHNTYNYYGEVKKS